ncbi:MAG: hypothetical protein CM15mP103_09640 [Gammaproteobacteria bacterium]|nr:MAG: hypothetical protein CM15mP103_09640 [Gammaproteobacteria bacterium]
MLADLLKPGGLIAGLYSGSEHTLHPVDARQAIWAPNPRIHKLGNIDGDC